MDLEHPTNQFLVCVILPLAVASLLVVGSIWLSGIDLNGCTEKIKTLCEPYIDSK